ncbi:predicted protein [Lichtheimia corymbifera JMRC:FSU:9682]|uniref:Uncharacterized protein n=1 Tax=Lichtheimia corymbifera JMRC:FSU:9682 TaxID=1263082 RepID=A0A068RKW8_9FUNG|nr:predicted protein [Lichtheimia corymbifera JMRC:FSU:9682]
MDVCVCLASTAQQEVCATATNHPLAAAAAAAVGANYTRIKLGASLHKDKQRCSTYVHINMALLFYGPVC